MQTWRTWIHSHSLESWQSCSEPVRNDLMTCDVLKWWIPFSYVVELSSPDFVMVYCLHQFLILTSQEKDCSLSLIQRTTWNFFTTTGNAKEYFGHQKILKLLFHSQYLILTTFANCMDERSQMFWRLRTVSVDKLWIRVIFKEFVPNLLCVSCNSLI